MLLHRLHIPRLQLLCRPVRPPCASPSPRREWRRNASYNASYNASDTASRDPASSYTASRDPASRDPASSYTASRDPASRDPASRDPASASRPSLYPPPLPSRLPFRDYDCGGGGGVEGVAAVSHCSTTLFPASPLPRLLLWGGGGGDGGGAAELGGAAKGGVVEWVWGFWGS
ncbi:unnamed protein product [Closterium sp. Naga37s-1]|nr:unnamed protein product [Closterium sp. Naga37s-1]